MFSRYVATLIFFASATALQFSSGVGKNGITATDIRFKDVTSSSGIRFQHFNAASPEKHIIETLGSGCAWIDYDADGLLDAFFVNGGPTPSVRRVVTPRHALFRNLGNGAFQDITKAAGIQGDGTYGMGAAIADYNNDGYPEVFLSGYPHSLFYHNNGDGTFNEVGRKAGLRHDGKFASSAGWFDYDRDGDLDLLVLNYLNWSYEQNTYCAPKPGYRAYCNPQNFHGASPTLYRNEGDGTFKDITREAGLINEDGKGLGLVLADFNNDGWTDIFIANDGVRNFYYRNRGDGTFEDLTYVSGLGYNEDGRAEAGMGTDTCDYDGDGLLDIFVTHLDYELNRLYRNLGNHRFEDYTERAGLSSGLNLFSGFGTRFADIDQDGWPDLIVINGHILDNIYLFHPQVTYAEEGHIYYNRQGSFQNISKQVGEPLGSRRVGRGLALGDYDNDGDMDLLISNNGAEGELLRNDSSRNHWLGLRLLGRQSNRDAVGTRVTLSYGKNRRVDQLKGGTSYLSSSDPRLFFGLGSQTKVDQLEIHWPGGAKQRLENLLADRFHVIAESSDQR